MISRNELDNAWAMIIPQVGQSVGRRADPDHPLDFFVSYDENNNMQFMLISDYQPNLPDSSKQIQVRGNKRTDGKYAICFSLSDEKLRDQFVSLCWDIMDCTKNSQNKKSGTRAAVKRFALWQKLFEEYRQKRLSDTETKGLIGELNVLKTICCSKYGIENAVAGWVGPIGADRDFEFSDCWYESKCVALSRDKVSISSFDQLDVDNRGYLVISRIEKTAPEAKGKITLNEIVESIYEMLEQYDNARTVFTNRLTLYGYNKNDDRSEEPYLIYNTELYVVDADDFPRIRRTKIHPAITDGEYSLSIPSLHVWKEEAD